MIKNMNNEKKYLKQGINILNSEIRKERQENKI